MAKKKPASRTRKTVAKKKPRSTKAPKTKSAVRGKTAASKKTSAKKTISKKTSSKKKPQRGLKKPSRVSPPSEIRSPEPSTLSPGTVAREPQRSRKGRGSKTVQSGDLQGLSGREFADSESVEELAAEGQSHEAEVVIGVEEADDPDEGEVRTHEILADDVPNEYLDED